MLARTGFSPDRIAQKTCVVCERVFTPFSTTARVCGRVCAGRVVKADKKLDKETDKKRREALETIPELIAAADKAFAAFIRERDRQAGHSCVSSGRPLDWSGNKVDAGHYRSRGAASHLRYHEDNCHAQSKHDNRHLAGNAVDYRIRLIERIGLSRVEALECDNAVHKWTAEGLRSIRAIFKQKLKELQQ